MGVRKAGSLDALYSTTCTTALLEDIKNYVRILSSKINAIL